MRYQSPLHYIGRDFKQTRKIYGETFKTIPNASGYQIGSMGSVRRKPYVDGRGAKRNWMYVCPQVMMRKKDHTPSGFFKTRITLDNGKVITPEIGALMMYTYDRGWDKDIENLPYCDWHVRSSHYRIDNLFCRSNLSLIVGDSENDHSNAVVYEFSWPDGTRYVDCNRIKRDDCVRQLQFELKYNQGSDGAAMTAAREAYKKFGPPRFGKIAEGLTPDQAWAIVRDFRDRINADSREVPTI